MNLPPIILHESFCWVWISCNLILTNAIVLQSKYVIDLDKSAAGILIIIIKPVLLFSDRDVLLKNT